MSLPLFDSFNNLKMHVFFILTSFVFFISCQETILDQSIHVSDKDGIVEISNGIIKARFTQQNNSVKQEFYSYKNRKWILVIESFKPPTNFPESGVQLFNSQLDPKHRFLLAEGFAALYRASHNERFLKSGEQCIDYLTFTQCCWEPHFIYTAFPFGGFGVDNSDNAAMLDGRQAETVKPFIWYGKTLGRQDLLERGIAAARSSVVLINLPRHKSNNIYRHTNIYPYGLGEGSYEVLLNDNSPVTISKADLVDFHIKVLPDGSIEM